VWHSLPTSTGTFDIIFVDIAFSAYQDTVRAVLDLKLLSQEGVIFVNNGEFKACLCLEPKPDNAVFARGFVSDIDAWANIELSTVGHWRKAGAMMKKFNAFIKNDARVVVSVVPMFEGVSEIRYKHT
jgi:predicted O-methyltransferase YrrM